MARKRVDRRVIWIVWLLVFLALGLVLGFGFGLSYEKLEFKRVIDGDTLVVLNRRDGLEWRVRLWGVNAPDSKECFYMEAGEALEREVAGKKLEYERFGYDGYGRILAELRANGENVEEKLVSAGAARVYDAAEIHSELKPSEEYINNLKKIEMEAKKGKRGIWSDMCK